MALKPSFPIYPIETIRDLVLRAPERYADQPAVMTKRQGKFQGPTYRELSQTVERLAVFLDGRGIEKGERVAVLSENRVEWAIAYLAVVAAGRVIVPIDRDLTEREIIHILRFAGVKLLVTSEDFLKSLREEFPRLEALQTVVSMEGERFCADLTFEECLDEGEKGRAAGSRAFSEVAVEPEDLAAIIFTSGTTGSSKGVMLTHGNIASNVIGTSHHVAINRGDVLLSVLPLHHTYECTAGFLTALYQGATIYHAENLRRIAENLLEIRATVLLGVPALFEAIYKRISAGIEEKGRRKFQIAIGIAAFSEKVLRFSPRRKLFGALHKRFGGRLRLMISGGAAINPEVSKGFRRLGIHFIQGYGMTEHSPIISVNRVDSFKDGSVGHVLPNAEVKIVDDEIAVRGPGVMKGYYLNEAATMETLRDGWLYTGDLGRFDDDGFLYISGRRKSVIVTPNGKNVYPEEIEALLNRNPFVLESLVWGGPEEDPSETEVQAIIVPDPAGFDQEFGPAEYDAEKMNEVISKAVRECNQELATFKRIKKFTLRGEEFEKTTTRKVKRYLYTGKTRPLSAGR